MALTKTDICNQTLDVLSQSATLNATDLAGGATAEARWFNRNYDTTLQATLRADVWSFAKDLTTLTADATAPAFDWSYRFELPDSWLRLLPLTEGGILFGAPVPYERVARFIHTNLEGPIKVRGIQLIEDPNAWDVDFIEVFTSRMAMKYAMKLTGKVNYLQIAQNAFDMAYDTARMVGAIEDYPVPVEEHDILRVRY